MDETCDTPENKTYFGAPRCLQMTLGLELELGAKRIGCAVRAVIKLYCTNVSCEWVSCLQKEAQWACGRLPARLWRPVCIQDRGEEDPHYKKVKRDLERGLPTEHGLR